MKPGTVTTSGAGLPPYQAPDGIPEQARTLAEELARLLAPIGEQEAEIARLTATRDEITRRRGKTKLNPEDRDAILQAAGDRLQSEAISERIEVLEGSRLERPLCDFLLGLSGFYRKALSGYYKEVVDHFARLLAPAFNDEAEARRALEPILPASNNLDAFWTCPSMSRNVRQNPTGFARTHLAYLKALADGQCPWKWPPAK